VSGERGRSTFERLVPELAPPEGSSPVASTFLRGLAIGALVGAAIAGSAILQRRRSHDEESAAELPAAEGSASD
jgi:hypothetical protein